MIKYFSLIAFLSTSLCAMDSEAPLSDTSHDTGSSSSSSSFVAPSPQPMDSPPFPPEAAKLIVKRCPWEMAGLNAAHALLPRAIGETPQERVESLCNFVDARAVYFNERTRELLNEHHERSNAVPTSLTFMVTPTAQEIEILARKFPNIQNISMKIILKKMKDQDKTDILKGLGRFSNLTSLDASYNNLGSDQAIAIAENLKGLKILNLFKNIIDDKGAMAIAFHLKEMTYLNVAWNSIY